MWDLLRPGLQPISLALTGRFSTTALPGKPCWIFNSSFNSFHTLQAREQFVDEKTEPQRGETMLWLLHIKLGCDLSSVGRQDPSVFPRATPGVPFSMSWCSSPDCQLSLTSSSPSNFIRPQPLLPNSHRNTASSGTSDIIQFILNAASNDSPHPPGMNRGTF